ncbi:hypothetical protein [Candidatus Trichorickettsia mobilis]|uniref:hypothetical protein n=1 Tax=Candidatus Trichorickettsia mobilis TaxID=1346319 RepID=UPI0029310158|nr:hypothetical protein [Candidatus Trichorickettsia mobilis]
MKYTNIDDYQGFKDVANTGGEEVFVENLASKYGLQAKKDVYSLLMQNAILKNEIEWVQNILVYKPDLTILNIFNNNSLTYALDQGNDGILKLFEQYYQNNHLQQEIDSNIVGIITKYILPDTSLGIAKALDYLSIFYSGVTEQFSDLLEYNVEVTGAGVEVE